MFLDASTDWQVAVRIVPGGHGLSYKDARADQFAALAAKGSIKKNYEGPSRSIGDQVKDLVKQIEARQTQAEQRMEERLLEHQKHMTGLVEQQTQHITQGVHTRTKECIRMLRCTGQTLQERSAFLRDAQR